MARRMSQCGGNRRKARALGFPTPSPKSTRQRLTCRSPRSPGRMIWRRSGRWLLGHRGPSNWLSSTCGAFQNEECHLNHRGLQIQWDALGSQCCLAPIVLNTLAARKTVKSGWLSLRRRHPLKDGVRGRRGRPALGAGGGRGETAGAVRDGNLTGVANGELCPRSRMAFRIESTGPEQVPRSAERRGNPLTDNVLYHKWSRT